MNDHALSLLRIRIKVANKEAQVYQVSIQDIRRVLIEFEEEIYAAAEAQQNQDRHGIVGEPVVVEP